MHNIHKLIQNHRYKIACAFAFIFVFFSSLSIVQLDSYYVSAQSNKTQNEEFNAPDNFFGNEDGTYQCGKSSKARKQALENGEIYLTKFNFGCLGQKSPKNINALQDVLFAIIRFLTAGVGVVLVLSIVVAGIQYSSSEGSAETTQAAKNRVKDAVIGLVFYLFIFAIVQFLVPGGFFTGTIFSPQLIFVIHSLL